jgi:hypothetical protein
MNTDVSTFTPETRFRELEEWSSLNALAVLNLIGKNTRIKILPDEMNLRRPFRNYTIWFFQKKKYYAGI